MDVENDVVELFASARGGLDTLAPGNIVTRPALGILRVNFFQNIASHLDVLMKSSGKVPELPLNTWA